MVWACFLLSTVGQDFSILYAYCNAREYIVLTFIVRTLQFLEMLNFFFSLFPFLVFDQFLKFFNKKIKLFYIVWNFFFFVCRSLYLSLVWLQFSWRIHYCLLDLFPIKDSSLHSTSLRTESTIFLFLREFFSFLFLEPTEDFFLSFFVVLDFLPYLSLFFDGRICWMEFLFNHLVLKCGGRGMVNNINGFIHGKERSFL